MTKTNRRADSGVSILNLTECDVTLYMVLYLPLYLPSALPASRQALLPLYRLITVSVRSSCAELEPT